MCLLRLAGHCCGVWLSVCAFFLERNLTSPHPPLPLWVCCRRSVPVRLFTSHSLWLLCVVIDVFTACGVTWSWRCLQRIAVVCYCRWVGSILWFSSLFCISERLLVSMPLPVFIDSGDEYSIDCECVLSFIQSFHWLSPKVSVWCDFYYHVLSVARRVHQNDSSSSYSLTVL